MNENIQSGIVYTICFLAVCYVMVRVIRIVRGRRQSGCVKCTAQTGAELHRISVSGESSYQSGTDIAEESDGQSRVESPAANQ